MVVCCS